MLLIAEPVTAESPLRLDWLCNQKHLLDPLIVLCSRAWKHEVARTLLARLWDYPDSNIDAVAQQKFRIREKKGDPVLEWILFACSVSHELTSIEYENERPEAFPFVLVHQKLVLVSEP